MADFEQTLSFEHHDTQQLWNLLAERVEAFIERWESGGEAPPLDEFAPRSPAPFRRLALVELVKVDLEYRWQQGHQPWRLEQYVAQFPELADGGISGDLLYEEFHVRRRHGDPCEPQEYFQRFPDQASQLARLLGVEVGPEATTSLFAGARPEPLEVGERVDDFDLLTQLGKGAFATVFLARQRSLQRMVALKISADRSNEPQTLAQLDHPSIVRVYDQRLLPERRLRLLYMQYVPGGTLQQAIERTRRLPLPERTGRALIEAVDDALAERGESPPTDSAFRGRLMNATWPEAVALLGTHLAAALHYAHERGVLHRDLKPANILLGSEGLPRLVDFNISFCSKLEGASPAAYFGGSLAYMAPEQLEACDPDSDRQADSLDARSDLYSLGVVLWELLTGSRPFSDEQAPGGWAGALKHMQQQRRAGVDPAALKRLRRAGAGELVDVLAHLLAPDPADRYPTAAEAARQLRLCLEPEARRLLRHNPGGWKGLARRFPLTSMLLTLVVPNAVAAWFNLEFNAQRFPADSVFWNLVTVINGIAFPLGIVLAVILARPIVRVMRGRRWRETQWEPALPAARACCLRLGQYGAVIGLVEWIIAGLAFPTLLHALSLPMQGEDYLLFLGSMTICGLIAASYPFFGVTMITMVAFYPLLLRHDESAPQQLTALGGLHRMTWVYLALAACVPMFGVALLAMLGEAGHGLAIGVLSVGGLIGFGLVFALARRLQTNLVLLADVLAASDQGQGTDSESFRAKFR